MTDRPADRPSAPDDLPRSPTGRVPQWVIDEAHGRATPSSSWRHAGLAPATQQRWTTRRWPAVAVAVVAVLVAVGVPIALKDSAWLSAISTTTGSMLGPPRPADYPAPSSEVESAPLGTAEPLATTSDAYEFTAVQADGTTPIAYDPCRPIHYVVRPDNEPEGGRELLSEAFARVSRATGLVFVDDGETTEAASAQRPATSPDRYGDRWSPVLVTWETADENADLATDVLGQAGSLWRPRPSDGLNVYVSGVVMLDAQQFAELLPLPNGQELAEAAVLHELGHLVGLGHVNDRDQLMYPGLLGIRFDFAPGDLTGLAALGGGECSPDL